MLSRLERFGGGTATAGSPQAMWAAGRYYSPEGVGSSSTLPLNLLCLRPLWVPPGGRRIDRIGFEVTTAGGAGGVFTAVIYAAGVNGYPGGANLLISAGPTSTTTTGVKETAVDVSLPGGLVWVGGVNQVSATSVFRIVQGGRPLPVAPIGTSDFHTQIAGYYQSAVTGAPPGTLDSALGTQVNNLPLVFVRAA